MNFQFEKNKLYNYLGEDLVEALKKHNAFVAGGVITSLFCNREINDIDVYFRNEDSLINFLTDIWNNGMWVVSHTKKATLFIYDRTKIQLIHFRYFNNPQEIFDTFDFTVCMGCFDFSTEEFVLHEDFLKHNSQRLLKFNSSTAFPIVSLLRVQKYQEKGYTISKPEFIRIILTCMNLEINSFDELKDQLGGMYGINYDKIFDNIKDEEFSLLTSIEKIADLSLSDEYFNLPESIGFNDLDDLIESISKKPVKYFIHNDEIYKINYQGLLVKTDNEPLYGVEISADEFFKENKFYKFVKKENDRYFSFYDPSFEYTIGEVVTAKGSLTGYYSGRLHFCELQELKHSTYSDRSDGVVIEVQIEAEDFIGLHGHILAKRCKVLREVPKEEYEQYL
jgi:hypothetical protein